MGRNKISGTWNLFAFKRWSKAKRGNFRLSRRVNGKKRRNPRKHPQSQKFMKDFAPQEKHTKHNADPVDAP